MKFKEKNNCTSWVIEREGGCNPCSYLSPALPSDSFLDTDKETKCFPWMATSASLCNLCDRLNKKKNTKKIILL